MHNALWHGVGAVLWLKDKIMTDIINDNDQRPGLNRILPALKANNRKQAFLDIATTAASDNNLEPRRLYNRLMAWERHSPVSSLGDGAAMLHIEAEGLAQNYTLFARLPHMIDYNSTDGQPVDLIMLLLSPQAEGPYHLQTLARYSRLLRDSAFCQRLRSAESEDAIRALFYGRDEARLAA